MFERNLCLGSILLHDTFRSRSEIAITTVCASAEEMQRGPLEEIADSVAAVDEVPLGACVSASSLDGE
jgi:hypothetical protein